MTIYKEHPEIATDLELTDEAAGGPYKHRLTDSSMAAIHSRVKTVRRLAKRFAAIDAKQLTGQDALHRLRRSAHFSLICSI